MTMYIYVVEHAELGIFPTFQFAVVLCGYGRRQLAVSELRLKKRKW